jgi:phosphate transport system protein
MSYHFYIEKEHLKNNMVSLYQLVEESVRQSLQAVFTLDKELAQKVIEADEVIDLQEVRVEEECLKLLALYQPVAKDLRFIVSVLKMNNDLERIADMGVSIARRALVLTEAPTSVIKELLESMSDTVMQMLQNSVDAFVRWNSEMAREICQRDDQVDFMFRKSFEVLKDYVNEDCSRVDALLLYSSVFKQLERIADLTTNIAEDVLYMSQGGIVRHQKPE